MAKYVIATPTGFIPQQGEGVTLDVHKAKLTRAEVEVRVEGLTRYEIIEVKEEKR